MIIGVHGGNSLSIKGFGDAVNALEEYCHKDCLYVLGLIADRKDEGLSLAVYAVW